MGCVCDDKPEPEKPKGRVRNEVMALACEMERKLAKHDGTRGSDGWTGGDTWEELHTRLMEESHELHDACENGSGVLSEAADVANFAMMVAMVAGGMDHVERTCGPYYDAETEKPSPPST